MEKELKVIDDRSVLLEYKTIRDYSCSLCEPLNIEDYNLQPAGFASPAKWHLAHTTWFFEEMILKAHLPNYTPFNNQFSYLYNSYYQSVGRRLERTNRGLITRPTVNEVYAYRHYVDRYIEELLEHHDNAAVNYLITIGVHHEQQHQELLLTDLKYAFSLNPIFPIYKADLNLASSKNERNAWVKIREGIYDIGHTGGEFCFDNELGAHKVFIHDFVISEALVTNGEYLEFIASGGYENFKLWLDEGWSWRQANAINAPLYWVKKNNSWFQFTLSGLQPVKKDAILCHISFYEAQAFATWKGMRLPTEFEWEIASSKLKWGQRWEWTYSAYLPYPNFKIANGALGEYNGKFMINQMVLRGASTATSLGHSRNTYRNFFQPEHRWQFTGIRLVK